MSGWEAIRSFFSAIIKWCPPTEDSSLPSVLSSQRIHDSLCYAKHIFMNVPKEEGAIIFHIDPVTGNVTSLGVRRHIEPCNTTPAFTTTTGAVISRTLLEFQHPCKKLRCLRHIKALLRNNSTTPASQDSQAPSPHGNLGLWKGG